MATDGKSKAQDALATKIQECFPYAHVSQENYIVDLIEECGFTTQELRRELGHEPHRMFVDIVMRDSEETIAFEYHGEQHYSLVGNMTKTDADLLLNQQLDQEKSWILSRIGIPLVPVPFDMYIDESVLYDAIDKAYESMVQDAKGYVACGNCDRMFPPSQLKYGTCKSCEEKLAEEEMEAVAAQAEAEPSPDIDALDDLESGMSYDDFKAKQKELAKQKRKEAYQAYKQSAAYQQKKEFEKQRRQQLNRQRKEENRRKRQEEKARKRAEKKEAQE